MAISFRLAFVIFVLALCLIASSQLLVKWRFGQLAGALEPGSTLYEITLAGLTDKWLWLAALMIVAGVICWYLAMVRLPLTLMFPVAGLVSPAVVVGAHYLLGEPLTAGQMGAVLIIAFGVALLGWLQ